MLRCVTGKKVYATEMMAEDALIESHIRFQYTHQGPIAVYHCDDCGYFHFTSQGAMNVRLQQALKDGTITRQKQAAHWEQKLIKRR